LSDELLDAVRRVLDGDVYLPQDLDAAFTLESLETDKERPTLTQRQELVLRELLDGRSNREISQTIGISDETVKTHVAAILRHFAVQNRTQAVVAAARFGYKPATRI
jgi:DNA-binding NarL/FixJ family response regulator